MVFRNHCKTFKNGVMFSESDREFQSLGTKQANDSSHSEILDRGTVKLRVSDYLNVLFQISVVGVSRLDI